MLHKSCTQSMSGDGGKAKWRAIESNPEVLTSLIHKVSRICSPWMQKHCYSMLWLFGFVIRGQCPWLLSSWLLKSEYNSSHLDWIFVCVLFVSERREGEIQGEWVKLLLRFSAYNIHDQLSHQQLLEQINLTLINEQIGAPTKYTFQDVLGLDEELLAMQQQVVNPFYTQTCTWSIRRVRIDSNLYRDGQSSILWIYDPLNFGM